MPRAMYSKACIFFDSGYCLEFEPRNKQTFPPEELIKLNCFAKKRHGVLFVHVTDVGGPSNNSLEDKMGSF